MKTRHTAPRPVGLRRIRFGAREVFTQGIERAVLQDLYHHFMTVSWPQLFGTIAAFFLVFDVLFGWLYHLVPGCIANLNPPGFAGAFFFSVETLATVGYGDMHPQTLYGHVVAMTEIFVGLMMLALITGMMFARFSRPTARFLFARYGVVRPIDGRVTLMFRAANARQNIVQEASAQLRLMRNDVTVEGYRIRRITDLPLVRSQHPMFILGWNLMHVIDEASPLFGATEASLREEDAEIVVSLTGIEETMSQTVHARTSYEAAEILWGRRFVDVLGYLPDGRRAVDFSRFHDTVEIPA